MDTSNLFSHPVVSDSVAPGSSSEPVDNPVFSDDGTTDGSSTTTSSS
jgi:hypothetical protein